MNKSIKIGFLLFLISFCAHAQKIEITPQYGYQVGAKYHFYAGHVQLTDSDQFGITVSAEINRDIDVEFFWAQQNSSIRVKSYEFFPIETHLTDIVVNHYQLGAIQKFSTNDLVPFAGASLGWTTFNPEDNFYDSNTKFTIGLTGGAKYYFSKRVGIRLQGQLLIPIQWGGVYFGTGGTSVSTGGSILLFNLSAGLIFALGK